MTRRNNRTTQTAQTTETTRPAQSVAFAAPRRAPAARAMPPTSARLLCALVLLCLMPVSAHAEGGNPFTDTPDEVTAAAEEFERRGPVAAWLTDLQRHVNVRLTELMRELQRDGSNRVLFTVLIAGFLYGMIHALLPGHRKTLLFSYFLAQDARVAHGVIAGVSLGILHAASATGIILVAYYVLRAGLQATLGNATAIMNDVTAWLVVALGALLLGLKIREALSGHEHSHGHAHGHAHSHGHGHEPEGDRQDHPHDREGSGGRTLPLIIVSGIVPCPGSALVMVFAITLGMVQLGVLTVTAISLGMAVVLSVLSVITIVLRANVLRLVEGRFGHIAHVGLELFGALFLLAFGLFLLIPGWGV